MLDDHSKVDPRLPFPNRTVKRLCADDSGWTSVKVGHRQALYSFNRPVLEQSPGRLCVCTTALHFYADKHTCVRLFRLHLILAAICWCRQTVYRTWRYFTVIFARFLQGAYSTRLFNAKNHDHWISGHDPWWMSL